MFLRKLVIFFILLSLTTAAPGATESSGPTRRQCFATVIAAGATLALGIQGKRLWDQHEIESFVRILPVPVQDNARRKLRETQRESSDNASKLAEAQRLYYENLIERHRDPAVKGDAYFKLVAREFFGGPLGIDGPDHVGLNLFLPEASKQELDTLFTEAELVVLRRAREKPAEAAAVVQKIVRKAFTRDLAPSIPFTEEQTVPVDVVAFLRGDVRARTLCRHHALLVEALMKHYGYTGGSIRVGFRTTAQIRRETDQRPNHAWFDVPEANVSVDATNRNAPEDRGSFYRGTIVFAYDPNGKLVEGEKWANLYDTFPAR